jgi:predicted nucleic acid-binding protein
LIALDTDVLAVYYLFRWDRRYEYARRVVESSEEKATTVVNVLELVGLMAIAQGGARAVKLFDHLHRRKDFKVLYWRRWLEQHAFVDKALEYVAARRSPLADALIGWILEDHGAEKLLTWNKAHFGSRYSFEVLTPEEYLDSALG